MDTYFYTLCFNLILCCSSYSSLSLGNSFTLCPFNKTPLLWVVVLFLSTSFLSSYICLLGIP